ncbi:MAG: 4,5-DOPA dioxygenase extradiol [Flavobacteriales bacterium]|nr:4,5-DOPA dioxygenase extradiol [Flavobacteriales bacterium]MCL4282594.1 4,5-DOPA dioxygenase extradiol [Flavobacteriales bacterium]
MDRRQFLAALAALPLALKAMETRSLLNLGDSLPRSPRMPVLFVGHGSPMNAIEENIFVQGFRRVAMEIPKPQAILVVSAHWETRGTQVTAMPKPPTIHDFGGFPRELYEQQYPAPGSPELAAEVQRLIQSNPVALDHSWGLDHGAWTVVKHMYPNADVPVIELSLDRTLQPERHYTMAKELAALRDKGVLIIGSGNMVHNLRMVAWGKINEPFAYDWAQEADTRMKQAIRSGDHRPLIDFHKQGTAFDLAINSAEHFLPLLYTLALQGKGEQATLFNDAPLAGSLTMTSVKVSTD